MMVTAIPEVMYREDCKKCGGDLFFEYDEHGLRVFCLQCGADAGVKLIDPVKAGINLHMQDKNFGSRFLGDNRNKGRHTYIIKRKSRSW